MDHDAALRAAYDFGVTARANECEGDLMDQLWEVEMRNGDWQAILLPGSRAKYGVPGHDRGPLSESEAHSAWSHGLCGMPLQMPS
ncbi:MAG: hypothetical protein ACOCXJ_09290 [Planctomycetota bacterium]